MVLLKRSPAKPVALQSVLAMEAKTQNIELATTQLPKHEIISYSVIEVLRLLNGEDAANPWALYSGQRVQDWEEDQILGLVTAILNKVAIPSLFVAKQSKEFYVNEKIKSSWELTKNVVKNTIDSTDLNRQAINFSLTKAKYISLLIDGQQRLTSLLVAFSGSFNGKKVYIDMDKVECVDGAIKFKTDCLSFNKKPAKAKHIVKLSRFVKFEGMSASEIMQELYPDDSFKFESTVEYVRIKSIAQAIKEAIFDVDALDVKTLYNMTAVQMAELFSNLNTTGTQCSDIDTIFSYLSAIDSEMYEEAVSVIGKYLVSFGVEKIVSARDFAVRILLVVCNDKKCKMNALVKEIMSGKDPLRKDYDSHKSFVKSMADITKLIDKTLKSNSEIRSSIAAFLKNTDDERVAAIMAMFIISGNEAVKNKKPLFHSSMNGTIIDEFLNVIVKHVQLIDQLGSEKAARYKSIYQVVQVMCYGNDKGEIGPKDKYKPLSFARAELGYQSVGASLVGDRFTIPQFEKTRLPAEGVAAMMSSMTGYTQYIPNQTDVEHMVAQNIVKNKDIFEERLDAEDSDGYDGLFEFAKKYNDTALNKMYLLKEFNRSTQESSIRKKIRMALAKGSTFHKTVLQEFGISNYEKGASSVLMIENIPFMYFAQYVKLIKNQGEYNNKVLRYTGKPEQSELTLDEMLQSFIVMFLKDDNVTRSDLFGPALESKLTEAVNEYGYIIG